MRFPKAALWLSALLVLGGCDGEDPPPPPPPPSPSLSDVTVTCNPSSVMAGTPSECTASATDETGAAVSSYSWESTNSSAAKVNPTGSSKMTVTTLAAGDTVIRATATRGTISKTGQATLKVTPVPPQPTVHSANITANETWRAADNPHVVRANIEVLGANAPTLTLEAGVEVRFEPGFGLSITNGTLKALGTQAAPIRLVSSQSAPAKGDWQGLMFSTAGSASELNHVTLSHCGKAVGQNACIAMKNQAAPVLRDVTVQNSGTTGVSVADDGSAFGPGSATLNISGSTSYAVRIGANQAGTLPTGGTFTGNAPDAVELRGAVSRTQTWTNPGVPYVVNDLVKVDSSASVPTLTLAAGTVFRFGSNGGLVVGEDFGGELIVSGTMDNPVLLTADSANPQPGHWQGVHLHRSTASNIAHATIEYAGAGGNPAEGIGNGNLNVYGTHGGSGGRPLIDSVVVRKGSGTGFYLLNEASFGPNSAKLTARDNGSYAISIEANYVGTLPKDTTISNNTRNAVEVRCCIVAADQTWPNLGVPYVINTYISVGHVTSNLVTLTLEPGTEVRFGSDAALYVGIAHAGVLKAIGTLEAPIRFVADTATTTRDYWRGLHFWKADGSQLQYVTVSQGGATGSSGTSGRGNVNVHRDIGDFLTNTTFRDSSCGLSLSGGTESGSTTVFKDFTQARYNNTFVNNTNRQCYH